MQPILRREWWFPLAMALGLALIGVLPYLYAVRAANPGETFMGFVGRGTPGANSYFAFSRQVAAGQTLVSNLYTAHAPSQAYFNPEWWLLGVSARATGLSLTSLFQIERVTAVFAFLGAVYYLCAVFLTRKRDRQWALALIALGSGFGWLVEAVGGSRLQPLDTQGVTLFAYLVNKPHFIRAAAFAALQYAWLIRGAETGRRGFFLASGVAASAHSLIRPYQIPEACLVLLLFTLAQATAGRSPLRRALSHTGWAFLGHAPAIAWYAWIHLHNPLGLGPMNAWEPQFLLSQVLWLGLPFAALLLYGGRQALTGSWRPEPSIPLLWLAAAMLLLQAHPWFPWGVESFFPWVFAPPLLFVKHVAPAVARWLDSHPQARVLRPLAVALLVILVLPGNALNYARFFTTLHQPTPPWRYYLPNDLSAGIRWLEANAAPESVVLASHDTSQFIPRLANLRVVSGQDVLTDRYREVNGSVLRFFLSPGDDAFKTGFCGAQAVSWIVLGPFEKSLAGFDPADHPWMRLAHREGDVALYRVTPGGEPAHQ